MSYIDPCVVSPAHYKLRHENDRVRIVEMTIPAGQKDNEHSHPNEIVFFITGGKARVHVGGEAVEIEVPDGHVMEHDAWTHVVENIGDKEIRAVIVETKA